MVPASVPQNSSVSSMPLAAPLPPRTERGWLANWLSSCCSSEHGNALSLTSRVANSCATLPIPSWLYPRYMPVPRDEKIVINGDADFESHTIEEISRYKEVTIINCKNQRSLSFAKNARIRVLHISHSNIENLDASNLSELTQLRCTHLDSPHFTVLKLAGLLRLEHLCIEACSHLQSIESLNALSRLISLHLSDLPSFSPVLELNELHSLFDVTVQLCPITSFKVSSSCRCLWSIHLTILRSLSSITLESLGALTQMHVTGCDKLSLFELSAEEDAYSSLKWLIFNRSFKSGFCLPDAITSLPNECVIQSQDCFLSPASLQHLEFLVKERRRKGLSAPKIALKLYEKDKEE